jgi:hypothetical protein
VREDAEAQAKWAQAFVIFNVSMVALVAVFSLRLMRGSRSVHTEQVEQENDADEALIE